MSKVICDVCGTSYPETATQCPICGCVNAPSSQGVSSATGENGDKKDGYTYVKGGRFSKANVRKRNGTSASANGGSSRSRKQKKTGNDNKGLVIVAIILFLAIIAVVLFITIRFVLNGDNTDTEPVANNNSTVDTNGDSADQPCEEIYFDMAEITLEEAGATEKLVVTVKPDGCTDELQEVVSDDPKVATAVLKDSVVTVTAVGPGETKIKLTCGEFTAECKVVCDFEEEKKLELTKETLTFTKKGDKTDIYPSDILRTEIEWTTDDASVASVELGTVTAVGEGETIIRAKYNDQVVECKVKCEFAEESEDNSTESNNSNGTAGSENVTEDGGSGGTGGSYALKNNNGGRNDDITLILSSDVYNEADFDLVDGNDNPVSGVTWTSSNTDCCTVEGGTIKAVSSGIATVTATYNGQSFTCTIRVNN